MTTLEHFGGAAIITGASSGIGAAFARALAQRGLDVVLVARRKDRLQSLAASLERDHGVKALALVMDLARPDAAEVLREAVSAAGLEVGLLVNNAGFGAYGSFSDQDPRRHVEMVDVNCRAPVALTHAFLPDMLARGRGAIVFVSSTSAYQPAPYLAVYGATKAFDLLLAEALWAELRPKGIDVLGLSPGFTQTDFHEVAGQGIPAAGGVADPEAVVATALAALGRKPSVIHGRRNWLCAWLVRFLPRSWVVRLAARQCAPSAKTHTGDSSARLNNSTHA